MLTVEQVTPSQAQRIVNTEEGQFAEVKGIEIAPAKLTKTVSAFANSDGGELFVGISAEELDLFKAKPREWQGFANQEAANGHLQIFEQLFPLGTDFQYAFLKCEGLSGLVLHVQINKTRGIVKASNDMPYIRRGAQNLPVDTAEKVKRLEYSKGTDSFESEGTLADVASVTESETTTRFIAEVIPTVQADQWLRKQNLIKEAKPTVACVLLFHDEPQAILPKRCGIKVYRYKTKESEGFRDAMAFTPKTVEGCLYQQIKEAVQLTKETAESIPKLGKSGLEAIDYPIEALHEIITNAVIHRDYHVADDVHIRIFDNRIEIENPGRLPAHITVSNILKERYARNGAIVRILNKFPDPPNKDVGEGLNTAYNAMHSIGLKEPQIRERENSVLVTIKHEPLASPEEAIMDYLQTHDSIKNAEARAVTHIRADHQIKAVFGRMVKQGLIERIPGTRTSRTAYRKPISSPNTEK